MWKTFKKIFKKVIDKIKKVCYNTGIRFKWAEIPTFIIGKGDVSHVR